MVTLSQAATHDNINEWHWFIDPVQVNFTYFDSCIGIVAPVQVHGVDNVIGIHLVQMTQSNEPISPEDMDTVATFLISKGYNLASNKAVIIGQISSWRQSSGIQYQRLKQGIKIIGSGHQIDLARGAYGGKFVQTPQGTKFRIIYGGVEPNDQEMFPDYAV
jgi:hypothetical protein